MAKLSVKYEMSCTPEEGERWTEAAEKDGRSRNNWFRIVLNQACEKILDVSDEEEALALAESLTK